MVVKKYRKWFVCLLCVMAHTGHGQKAEKLQWTSIAQLSAKQALEPRPVLVDVYTDWCGWCKVMDKKTYGNASVAAYLNRKYYVVKFNAESRDPVLWNGKIYRYSQRYAAHELAVHLTKGQLSYPTTVFLPTKNGDPHSVAGFLSVKDFEVLATYFGEGKYPKMPMEDYLRGYKPQWK